MPTESSGHAGFVRRKPRLAIEKAELHTPTGPIRSLTDLRAKWFISRRIMRPNIASGLAGRHRRMLL